MRPVNLLDSNSSQERASDFLNDDAIVLIEFAAAHVGFGRPTFNSSTRTRRARPGYGPPTEEALKLADGLPLGLAKGPRDQRLVVDT